MLGTIILREMQEYIKSKKFLIGFLTTVLLVSLSTMVSIEDYSKRHQEYLDAEHTMRFTGSEVRLYKPPQVLGILVHGQEQKLGVVAIVMTRTITPTASGYISKWIDSQKMLFERYSVVDFAFIVRVFMSLMVIFLVYGSIVEDKERGMLRLTLSNNVPRHTLLAGKMLGGMAVISLSLLFSLFCCLLMIVHPAVTLEYADLGRILLIYGVSFLFLMVFLMMSFFVSVIVNYRSSALLILLQVWLITIVIYPNVARIITEKLHPLPTLEQWTESRKETLRPYDEESRKAANALAKDLPVNQQVDLWKSYLKREQNRVEARYSIRREYLNLQIQQAAVARSISLPCPSISFDYTMDEFAHTGMDEHVRFLEKVFWYWKLYLPTEKEMEIMDLMKSGKILSYLPEFQYQGTPIRENVKSALSYILLLVLTSAVFCSLSFMSFLIKDVR